MAFKAATVPGVRSLRLEIHVMILRRNPHLDVSASILAACLLSPLHAQQLASITVDAGRELAPVNCLVFGQNMEAADNAFASFPATQQTREPDPEG